MTSIADLARELGCQHYEIREFYQDGISLETSDMDELPADVVTTIREAWHSMPDVADIVQENRNADAVLDAVADIVNHAGYEDLS